jgi:DNA-binding Lrp family transcriptional regulator
MEGRHARGRSAPVKILAFVMINVKVGTDRDTVSKLRTLKGIREVHEVYAVYDIVAIIEAETMAELNELVNSEIRKIESVTSTNTIIAEKYA